MMTMAILLSEVVGNLESTGMVPRLKSNSPRRWSWSWRGWQRQQYDDDDDDDDNNDDDKDEDDNNDDDDNDDNDDDNNTDEDEDDNGDDDINNFQAVSELNLWGGARNATSVSKPSQQQQVSF